MTQRPDPFRTVVERLVDLHNCKTQDYGSNDDPYANIRGGAKALGLAPWIGAHVRLNDKTFRLNKFARDEKLANESARDSMEDQAVYAIIELILFEEEQV
jgi:hypothetical protein